MNPSEMCFGVSILKEVLEKVLFGSEKKGVSTNSTNNTQPPHTTAKTTPKRNNNTIAHYTHTVLPPDSHYHQHIDPTYRFLQGSYYHHYMLPGVLRTPITHNNAIAHYVQHTQIYSYRFLQARTTVITIYAQEF